MANHEISKRFVLGFDNEIPSRDFLLFVKNFPPGGFIFFERNFADIDSLKENIEILNKISPSSLFMIDEEGGVKSRLRWEHNFPNPPDPRIIANDFSVERARSLHRECAKELKKIGFDMNLAPVVDVAGENHILGPRSFSDDADICARYSVAIIEGIIEGGLFPCAKHFPGLGSAKIDPHIGISIADESADFQGKHFLPFMKAISANVPAIMTTHLIAPSLDDSNKIATISPKMIKILREKLNFNGVIISDDLLMGGSLSYGSLEDITISSLACGHDIVLICKEVLELDRIIISARKEIDPKANEISIARIQRYLPKTS